MRRLFSWGIAVFFLTLATDCAVWGETFVLDNGSRIQGRLINPQENPRRHYQILLEGGVKITLNADSVQVVPDGDVEEDYRRLRPAYPDTVEGQWALAEWCQKEKLTKREIHLNRILELDPEHVEARRLLGYNKIDGQWATQEELMTKRGYQIYRGRWMLAQEIELIEKKEANESAQQEWFRNLKRWRGWLGTNKDAQAREKIRSINDPAAVRALIGGLRGEGDDLVRLLYLEALANIDAPEAAKAMAILSIEDPVSEVRLTALDLLTQKKRPEVIDYYVTKLRDKDNTRVNLAAVALGRMKEPSTTGPLISALVTKHKFKISKAGGDNSMTTTFGGSGGGGGGGMSMGGGPTIITKSISNQAVLDALSAVTGQNFGFDQSAWKRWYSAQKRPESLDARRD